MAFVQWANLGKRQVGLLNKLGPGLKDIMHEQDFAEFEN